MNLYTHLIFLNPVKQLIHNPILTMPFRDRDPFLRYTQIYIYIETDFTGFQPEFKKASLLYFFLTVRDQMITVLVNPGPLLNIKGKRREIPIPSRKLTSS